MMTTANASLPTSNATEAYPIVATLCAVVGLFIVMGVGTMVGMLAFGGLLNLVNRVTPGTSLDQIMTVRMLLSAQLGMSIATIGYLVIVWPRLAGKSLIELGLRGLSWRNVGLAIVAALVMSLVVNGLATGIEAMFGLHQDQDAVTVLKGVSSLNGRIGLFFIMAVLAPITEELMFRGFCFSALKRYFGLWPGAVVSALAFGAMHGNLIAFVPLSLGGLILVFVYYRTGSLYASMLTHGIFNALSIVIVFATMGHPS